METIETSRTDTHEFYVRNCYGHESAFVAEFKPINKKTGKAWQASHRIEDGADVQPENWGRPIAFSTLEAAREAVEQKKLHLARAAR